MPRPRARLDHAAIAAAFAPDGLHGVSSAEVARRAGVAKPTVYARGGSKEGVFLACVEAEVERLLSLLSRADLDTRALPARLRLTAIALAVIDHVLAHPDAARLLHLTARHRSSGVAGAVDAALARLSARIALLLRTEATPESAEQVAVALLGAAAAVGFARPREPAAAAAMLGGAFAAVLEPAPAGSEETDVQAVGLY
ncbi:MAG TPA: helix-turn-helix domain-containing protein [Solirubrobacteraceae bacterium]|nr:helix-turn-helix domain-containing protein [Solirubrobacteraceae bacterium]